MLFSADAFCQMDAYQFKRKLNGIDSTYHKIILPNDIYQHLNPSFTDLRIYGITAQNDTFEAPYIIQIEKEKIRVDEVPFKLINESKNPNTYYYTFENLSDEAINKIKLDFKNTDFDWKVKLEGSQNQQEWFTILEEYRILSLKNSKINYQFTDLNLPESKFKYFRIQINSEAKPILKSTNILLSNISTGNYQSYGILARKKSDDKERKQTVIDFSLQQLVPVSRIKIQVNNPSDYYRNISIKYLSDSVETEKGWQYSYQTFMNGTLNSFENNQFNFDSKLLKNLRIIIDNQDNAPLDIAGIEVSGYTHTLIARFNNSADYHLFYGKPNARKPQYDLTHFADKIPSNLPEITLGVEEKLSKIAVEKREPIFTNKNWLWAIMLVIIALLGWATMKMLKKG